MEMAVATPVAHEDRKHTAQRIANEMFHQQPDWITFFREVLGVDGLLRKLFASPEELAAFEKTAAQSASDKPRRAGHQDPRHQPVLYRFGGRLPTDALIRPMH